MTAAAESAAPRSLWSGRALVLAGIVVSAFTLRTAVTAITPLLGRIGAQLDFGSATIGVFGMLPPAAFAAFGLATPALARRIGLERTALLAMLLAAIGMLTRAMAAQTGTLLVLSVLALGGMGMGNVVLPPLVKRYFGDRVGAISTIYIVVLTLGTMVPALVAVPLADATSWRVSIASWTIVAVLAAVPWALVLLAERRPSSPLSRLHDAAVAAGGEAAELEAPAPTGRVWRSPISWGLAAMFGMTSLITYSFFTWLPTILVSTGSSAAFGGTMVALFAGMGLVSAFTAPGLVVRIANPFPIVVGCAVLFFVGFAGLLYSPQHLTVLWVVIAGLGPSTFPMALTMINLRTRTPAGSSAMSGFTQGLGYSVACLGPVLFGVLHQVTSAWTAPFALLSLAVVVMVIGGYAACQPRMLEDSW
ncbi:MAG TPA: MFS transporter [Candidatus Nanopelagicales bacterium]